MRNVHELTMMNSEDGDCLMKCLQEVFYWYGYPLNTYKLCGITNCFKLEALDEPGRVKCIRSIFQTP